MNLEICEQNPLWSLFWIIDEIGIPKLLNCHYQLNNYGSPSNKKTNIQRPIKKIIFKNRKSRKFINSYALKWYVARWGQILYKIQTWKIGLKALMV